MYLHVPVVRYNRSADDSGGGGGTFPSSVQSTGRGRKKHPRRIGTLLQWSSGLWSWLVARLF